jgi:hypothetical protein
VLRNGRLASIVVIAPETGAAAATMKPQGALLLLPLVGLAGCLDSAVQREPSI